MSALSASETEIELDLIRYELRKNGTAIRLERQPMELLILLIEGNGRLVGREEIAARLWGNDVFVDTERGVNNAIRKIRMALDDSSERPRYLETVVGKGYRFVGSAKVIAAEANGPTSTVDETTPAELIPPGGGALPAPARHASNWRTRVSRLQIILGALLILTLIVTSLQGIRSGLFSGRHEIRSIAVLPLQDLSGEPDQQYFADGVTEELTTDLARIRSLTVKSRTSAQQYRDTKKSIRQIAQELGVEGIVEGSVARAAGKVRITVQLIDAANDRHIWAETYERALGEVLSVQDSVAEEIARQVQARVTPDERARLRERGTQDSRAYEAYLRGRHFLTLQRPEALKDALAQFQKAVDLDPTYASAYAGLADTFDLFANYSLMAPKEAFPRAKAAAAKSLELDHTLAEPYASLGFAKNHFDWDWEGAELDYKRAIELSPNYAIAYLRYAELLSTMGRHDEALGAIRHAEELDPLSIVISANIGRVLYHARRYDEAIEQIKKTLQLDPTRGWARNDLGMAYEQKQMYREAAAEIDQASARLGWPYSLSTLHLYAVTFRRGEAKQKLQVLERGGKDPFFIAGVHAALGETEEAFRSLNRAYQDHDFFLAFLKVHPWMDPLRSDQRFAQLMQQINLR